MHCVARLNNAKCMLTTSLVRTRKLIKSRRFPEIYFFFLDTQTSKHPFWWMCTRSFGMNLQDDMKWISELLWWLDAWRDAEEESERARERGSQKERKREKERVDATTRHKENEKQVHSISFLGLGHTVNAAKDQYTRHSPVSIRQHIKVYVSIRQHTSAYVRTRQHTSNTSAYVELLDGLLHTSSVILYRIRRNAHLIPHTKRKAGGTWSHASMRARSCL